MHAKLMIEILKTQPLFRMWPGDAAIEFAWCMGTSRFATIRQQMQINVRDFEAEDAP
jgi:hypothetical protein